MEPELDNGSVVELVYLAAHGDEAVAVLNLLHVFFPGRLGADLTEHRLGEGGAFGGEAGVGGSDGVKVVGEKKKQRKVHERVLALRLSSRLSVSVEERGRHRQCHHSDM